MICDATAGNKKHRVMQDTWGHLYPEPGSKHPCKILVMHHGRDTIVLDRVSALADSPVEFELVCSVLGMFVWSQGLHEVDCVLWFYKTSSAMFLGKPIGKIVRAEVKTLHGTANWASAHRRTT